MADSGIEFGLEGIGHQLAERRLAVPIYQRSFAWTGSEVDDFCEDLRDAFGRTPREYFLGTVVLTREGIAGRDTVIDGQQRLATASLFLCALRDRFRAEEETKRADLVHTRYLATFDDTTGVDEPRLYLNSEDHSFYSGRIVDGDASVEPTRPSHQLILGAYKRLEVFVDEIVASAGSNWVDVLVEWRHFLESSVRIVGVRVSTESDAFMIFETLNTRGLDLTLADLLKNLLFGKAGETKLNSVRENWTTALANLDSDVELFITFIRHYWSSKHGQTRERDLYKSIRAEITSGPKAVALAKELESASKLYAALINSRDSHWTGWGTTTTESVDTLSRLGLEQNRPMLLAALQHITKPQVKSVLRSAVAWSVRGLIVGGIGGGTTEKAFSRAAVDIRAGKIKGAPELLASLGAVVPSDAEFERDFATARVTKAKLARYYLLALERTASQTEEPELVPNANEDEVNLEHVLPKKATHANWPQFSVDQRRALLHRIGNLVLLSKTPNANLGNRSFRDKKPTLDASELVLTNKVGATRSWSEGAIERRQKELAKLAVATWRR